jgi:hypothetical protein
LKPYGGDARVVKLLQLKLGLHQVFGYCFDFEVDWYRFISLEKIERAVPTVQSPGCEGVPENPAAVSAMKLTLSSILDTGELVYEPVP